ncbi:hypothetical protein AYO40_07020 [Planctomycetaceae bacterium SCGC AG-212-D15]|nr:hypothetical protein AYO40_07020 [Planctomycetaceae bacterium SCGC AG-212-D15]
MSKVVYVLLAAVAVTLGCESEEQFHKEMNEAMKDARGENMEMRSDFSTLNASPKKASRTDDN